MLGFQSSRGACLAAHAARPAAPCAVPLGDQNQYRFLGEKTSPQNQASRTEHAVRENNNLSNLDFLIFIQNLSSCLDLFCQHKCTTTMRSLHTPHPVRQDVWTDCRGKKEIRIRDSVEWDSVFQSTKQNLNRWRVWNGMESNRVTVRSFRERATHTCLL